jgi:outer membrane protein
MRSRITILALLISAGVSAQEPMPLTLHQAEGLAVQNNPALSSAQFTAGAAGQVPLQARAAYLPTVSGNITGVGADSGSRLAAGALNNPVVYSRLGTGLQLNQLITDFGRTSNLVSSARLRAEAQNQATLNVRANILLETDRAYFGVLRAQSLLTVAAETVKTRQTVADQITQLTAAKLKSQLDLSFANVNLADAKLQLSDAQNGLKSAKAELATAIGLPGQEDFVLAEELMPDAPPDQVDPVIAEAIQKRPELTELKLQADAAQRFVQAERALQYPTVGVLATAGFVPAGESTVPGRYGAIGANISIPILNGGLFRARRTEAEFRAKAASKDVEDLQNRIIRDVRTAYLGALNAYERMGLTVQLLDQAKLGMDLAQGRYDLGLGSIVELSQAQLNYTSAQIVNSSAKYDYQVQHALVQYQTGVLR